MVFFCRQAKSSDVLSSVFGTLSIIGDLKKISEPRIDSHCGGESV